jgi:antitoxin component YwqK of YwqJK toxin-antitoxin module
MMDYTYPIISTVKTKVLLLCLILSGLALPLQAQFSFIGAPPPPNKYKASQVIDPERGIAIYDKMNIALGDSSRQTPKGYAASDWIEDYYENGNILHKGFYIDGKLKVYKNFWESGKVERNFRFIDFTKSQMTVYYKDGQMRSDIIYKEGAALKTIEYYPNGKLDFDEEYDKNMEYLLGRKSYYENGNPQSILELKNPKKKQYYQTDYFENGKVKEEGPILLIPGTDDYRKDGSWKVYDESGKLVAEEEYAKGTLSSQKKH